PSLRRSSFLFVLFSCSVVNIVEVYYLSRIYSRNSTFNDDYLTHQPRSHPTPSHFITRSHFNEERIRKGVRGNCFAFCLIYFN
ncbi:hypothetical protein ACHAXS_012471, partial [Conticribra weissflogii]